MFSILICRCLAKHCCISRTTIVNILHCFIKYIWAESVWYNIRSSTKLKLAGNISRKHPHEVCQYCHMMLGNNQTQQFSAYRVLLQTWPDQLQILLKLTLFHRSCWVMRSALMLLHRWLPRRKMSSSFIKTRICYSWMLFSTWMLQNLIITTICYWKCWVDRWSVFTGHFVVFTGQSVFVISVLSGENFNFSEKTLCFKKLVRKRK